MAVTKIHPIKSTLKQALDYIENPDKTDGKMLVSSFGCSYETADIEFEMLLAQAMQKGNNLAHHLIQSFAPGEAVPGIVRGVKEYGVFVELAPNLAGLAEPCSGVTPGQQAPEPLKKAS